LVGLTFLLLAVDISVCSEEVSAYFAGNFHEMLGKCSDWQLLLLIVHCPMNKIFFVARSSGHIIRSKVQFKRELFLNSLLKSLKGHVLEVENKGVIFNG